MSDRLRPGLDIVPCERIEGDDFYLVSGDSIVAMRDGKAVRLEGAEAERVRRWVIRDAAKKREVTG